MLVDIRGVAAMLSLSEFTVRRMHQDGRLGPRPVQASVSKLLWRRDEIERWASTEPWKDRHQWNIGGRGAIPLRP